MDATAADIRRRAMDLLARREHSVKELVDKLGHRCGDTDMVLAEVERLRQEGLQSDARLAEALIRSRVGRGQGPVKMREELRSKGVAPESIRCALEESGIDWIALAASVASKRFGDTPAEDAKEKARRARFLQQRGFSFDHIASLL